jgi:hypothetical protein
VLLALPTPRVARQTGSDEVGVIAIPTVGTGDEMVGSGSRTATPVADVAIPGQHPEARLLVLVVQTTRCAATTLLLTLLLVLGAAGGNGEVRALGLDAVAHQRGLTRLPSALGWNAHLVIHVVPQRQEYQARPSAESTSPGSRVSLHPGQTSVSQLLLPLRLLQG